MSSLQGLIQYIIYDVTDSLIFELSNPFSFILDQRVTATIWPLVIGSIKGKQNHVSRINIDRNCPMRQYCFVFFSFQLSTLFLK